MQLVSEESIKDLCYHYPEEYHELIILQVKNMEKIIKENQDRYFQDLSFRSGLDLILGEIVKGSFLLLKGDIDEN